MPLPPPVIKIVSLVSFIIKCPAPIKDARLPGTADTIHRTVSISPSRLSSLVRRPTDTSCDSRPDSPERFATCPATQSAMVMYVPVHRARIQS